MTITAGHVWEGTLEVGEGRFAVVVSRFNRLITERLLEGAMEGLVRHGVVAADIDVAWVPGAWEIPPVVWRLADTGRYRAIIAVGCVFQGETAHADEISSYVAGSLGRCAVETGVPVAHGVITPQNHEQALQRCGLKSGNRGWDAALAALEMAALLPQLPVPEP